MTAETTQGAFSFRLNGPTVKVSTRNGNHIQTYAMPPRCDTLDDFLARFWQVDYNLGRYAITA